jgi:hypothetical protein
VLDRAASPTDKEHDHVGSPRTHAPLAMTRPSAAEIQSLDPYAFLAVLGKRVICVLAAATARAAADPGGGDDRHAVLLERLAEHPLDGQGSGKVPLWSVRVV